MSRFSDQMLAVLRDAKGLRIRAGNTRHRFIGIWFVLMRDRVFVRSWSVKPDGWYRTFLKDPHGIVIVADHEIPIRAVATRSSRLRNAVDRAYLTKYSTPVRLNTLRILAARNQGQQPLNWYRARPTAV